MFGVLIRPGEFLITRIRRQLTFFYSKAFRNFAGLAVRRVKAPATSEITRNFSQLSIQPAKPTNFTCNATNSSKSSILSHPEFLRLSATPAFTQVRTVTKFSLKSGKRKTVRAALKRFKRLDWGIWVRTIAGRNKRIWKKSGDRRRKARQHVFTNSTQVLSKLDS